MVALRTRRDKILQLPEELQGGDGVLMTKFHPKMMMITQTNTVCYCILIMWSCWCFVITGTYQYQKYSKQVSSEQILKNDSQPNNTTGSTIQLTTDACRSVFGPKGHGGLKSISIEKIKSHCKQPLVYNVCEDLQAFTGLSDTEMEVRLRRIGRFHFEGEHEFWHPQTSSELAWYYTTSVDYVFANAIHVADLKMLQYIIDNRIEPVLDYSGGVGNNVLHLAETHGLMVQYFGIGIIEYKFAQYRIIARQLTDKVTFKLPYGPNTGHKFDPINGPLPRDGSLGAILAMDVLEHIPNYHVVVEAMVDSIRIGGVIAEFTPFAKMSSGNNDIADAVHLTDGGITMDVAMGSRMQYNQKANVWIKISNEKEA